MPRAAALAALAVLAAPPLVGQALPATAADRRWLQPVASLVVPGSGQLLGGHDRGTAYLALEAYLVSRYLQLRRDGGREAARFRTLAFDVARRDYAPVRRDTVFEYYEQMEVFAESGEYDRDPGPAFAPESDPTTYNGSVWQLARRTYWSDPDSAPDPTSPEYQEALAFYRARAVGPDYRWSWRDAGHEQEVFRQAIRSSDRAFRRAQGQLGVLLANHVLSAVDALVSTRLAAVAARPTRVETTLGPRGRLHIRVQLAL